MPFEFVTLISKPVLYLVSNDVQVAYKCPDFVSSALEERSLTQFSFSFHLLMHLVMKWSLAEKNLKFRLFLNQKMLTNDC